MLKKVDELILITRCTLSDDRDAFGRLVEKYQSEIKRFFMNLTGDAALSDDLAQETFIKAYTGIRGFRGMAKFSTWLYRIAYNEFYSWNRQRREEREPESIREPSTGEWSGDIKLDVWTAVGMLGEPARTIVVLFYIDDKPIKEIAAITSLPEGTVKSHISRAKSKLAEFLQNN